RPVGVLLDALADFGVGEHVDAVELLHAAGVQHLAGERGETALGKLRRALHIEHDGVTLDLLLDALFSVHGTILPFHPRRGVCRPDRASRTWFQGLPPRAARARPPAAPCRARAAASRPAGGERALPGRRCASRPARRRRTRSRAAARTASARGAD